MSPNKIKIDVKVADTFFLRLRGLSFRYNYPFDRPLFFPKCSSIHTFGMFFKFDLLFLDSSNRVVALYSSVKPFKIHWQHKAVSALEMPIGFLEENNIHLYDNVDII